jgi:imidazolonepropionase-like amidohydrolase
MLVAGYAISPTGGHADRTHGYREDLFDAPGAEQGIADGPYEARKAVRAQVKRGADLIKLTATGGVLSNTSAGTEVQFKHDELEEIVSTAHMLGRKVAAHAHGAKGVNAALRAGVDSIEHGTFLDADSIELFKKTGAWYVPTVIAGKTVEERAKQPGFYPPAVAEKAREVGPQIQDALRRAQAGGVRIAFGTDAGVFPHGENARELQYMVEAGMSPMEVLRAATVGSASLLGLESELGTLEVGKRADLIATRRNPLVDVTELSRVVFVMRDGTVYKRE